MPWVSIEINMSTIQAHSGQLTAPAVRGAFKALGYKLSIRTNPLSRSIGNLVVSGQGLDKMIISSATVIGRESFSQHAAMFELANSVRGTVVDGIKIS